MNKPKFTEGPWCALPEEVDKPYIRIRGTIPGSRYKIANVVTPVYEGVHEREAEETRANARLIKMAPTMYRFLDDISNGRGVDYPIEQLLSEVRGETND